MRDDNEEVTISPVGDMIALVGGIAAVVIAGGFNWYSPAEIAAREGAKTLKGVSTQNPAGLVCFAVGVGVVALAAVALVVWLVSPRSGLEKGTGWVYAIGASVIFIACILGLALPPDIAGVEAGIRAGVIVELFAAATIAVGGLLKI